MNRFKKVTSLFLTCAIMTGNIPMSSYAEETVSTVEDTTIEENVTAEEDTSEENLEEEKSEEVSEATGKSNIDEVVNNQENSEAIEAQPVMMSAFRAAPGASASVTNETELKAALADPNVTEITIANSFAINSNISINNKEVKIIGAGNTLTGNTTNMFVISSGSNVTFDDVNFDANGQGRIFSVSSAKVSVINGSLKNGLSAKEGVAGNTVQVEGGAINANDATLNFTGTIFENNRAVKPASNANTNTRPHGGAIYAYRSTINFTNITALNNASGSNAGGGVVFADVNSTINVTASNFEGNNCTDFNNASKGGAISIYGESTLNSTGNTYSTARGFNHGGSLYAHNSTINSTNDTYIIPNLGDAYGISGGSIGLSSGTLNIEGGTFKTTANSFTKVIHAGGYIAASGPNQNITIKNTTFTGRGQWASMATFGGAIALEDSGGNVLLENTTITNTCSDNTGGAITISSRHGQPSSYDVTLRNVSISNTGSGNVGGGVYAGPGNTLKVEGGSFNNSVSSYGGAINNDGTTTVTGGNTITNTGATKLGGGIYNNGYLKLDNMTLDANSIAQYPGVSAELAGSNVYAAKDVIITPNATISADKDVRVIDKTSKILLTGELTNNIHVSVSESMKPNTIESNAERYIGYTVAAGTDNYIPTKEDAKKLHYMSVYATGIHSQPVATIDDHSSIAKWDFVLNPEENTVVLGQRAVLIYHANKDNFTGAKFTVDNPTEEKEEKISQVYDVYSSVSPWTNPAQMSVIADVPTAPNYKFVTWYNAGATGVENITTPDKVKLVHATEAANASNNKFDFASKYFINATDKFTGLLGSNGTNKELHAFAGYVKVFKITHKFEKDSSVDASVELPQAIKDRITQEILDDPNYNNLENGANKTANAAIDTTDYFDATNNGTWKFVSWTSKNVPINNQDGEFIGTWRLENKYQVTHEFIKADGVKPDLPVAISDRTKDKVLKDLVNNQKVKPDSSISTEQYEDSDNDGTWTFVSWDNNGEITINKANDKFVGTWVFNSNKYMVTHEFKKLGKVEFELPAAIFSRTDDKDLKDLVNGSVVNPNSTINKSDYNDGENDGVWTFSIWDNPEITINKSNGKFVGFWDFTQRKYIVTHEFKKADGVSFELPADISSRTNNKDLLDLVNKQVVRPDDSISTDKYVDEENDGTWTFISWDNNGEITINKANGKFIGTWNFTPKTYKSTHKFVSGTAGKTLPSDIANRTQGKDKTGWINNDTVTPNDKIDTKSYIDPQTKGTWKFVSWDESTKTVKKADINFVGTWVYEAPQPSGRPSVPKKPTPVKEDGLLNIEDHSAYMFGYPDKTFRPSRTMTRAEVTLMFARLLVDRPANPHSLVSPFKDVDNQTWYSYGITYMNEKNIITGYPDGTFRPDAPITRAEFAAIAARFDKLDPTGKVTFSDVPANYWATEYIDSASTKGWVGGYPDGTFGPRKFITRAEVVSITNRMLNRHADEQFINANKMKLVPMIDLKENHWAYMTIVEAINGHDYLREKDGVHEDWDRLNHQAFHFPTPYRSKKK